MSGGYLTGASGLQGRQLPECVVHVFSFGKRLPPGPQDVDQLNRMNYIKIPHHSARAGLPGQDGVPAKGITAEYLYRQIITPGFSFRLQVVAFFYLYQT